MTIMAVYSSADVTPEAYAAYEAGIRSQPVPAEALLHQVAFDQAGGIIVDLWTSRTALDAWTETRIKPTLAKYGIGYVAPRILDVDVVTTPGALKAFTQLNTRAPQLA